MRRVCLIVNPRSAAGSTSRRFAEIADAADRQLEAWDMRKTERAGHATELARQAIDEGFDAVVAVGGDGTANEVINGFFEDGVPVETEAHFAVVPAGTGCDLVKTLHMPRDLDKAFALVHEGDARATDVVCARFIGPDGEPAARMGINVIGFGMEGEVVARANASSKRFGGTLTFLGATVSSLLAYTPAPVELVWTDADGAEQSWSGELVNMFLANAEYAGGGMWLGKGAQLDDGLMEVTLIPKLPLRRLSRSLPHLYSGHPERVRGIQRFRASRVAAVSTGSHPVLIDIDGEQPGRLDASFEVVPRSVGVIFGPPA